MSDTHELITLRDFIRYAVSHFNQAGLFFGHGTENAWDEAVTLVLRSLHLPHNIDPSMIDARLTHNEHKRLSDLIYRRINERIPLPYLINEAWFAGLPFYVDERVLIPRSPLAEMIEKQFSPWLQPESIHSILDLCTGSGCIAIACAKAFPDAEITATDISTDALTVAKINVLRHEVQDQVELIEADLFQGVHKKYDLIIGNPPYVDATDMAALPPEYLHEPRLGLAAGHDGLEIVTRILQQASSYLNPNGFIMIEVGNSEINLAERYPEIPFIWLEFERGGGGVFLLSAEQLKQCASLLQNDDAQCVDFVRD